MAEKVGLAKIPVEIFIDKAAWDQMTDTQIQVLAEQVEDQLELALVSAGREVIRRLGNGKLSYKVD